MDVLSLIGRKEALFAPDLLRHDAQIASIVASSRFLVIGGAGSIGQAVCKELFKRNPKALHVVDISENNMVELVRELRSTVGYIDGEFRTYAVDCGSTEFSALLSANENYDYVLNLSALKHVRSEKDPFTLMRLLEVNITNTVKTIRQSSENGVSKYFCVSTDKAANPVNMMGASKRIMELFLMAESEHIPISTARFANVAFSDGSLLHGFNQRFAKRQPISAPSDVTRYFVTPQESGELCLLSALLGENKQTFFPKLSEQLHLTSFSDIAERYVRNLGFEPFICETEEEAREKASALISKQLWPCYFFTSDTTGEKDFEEFFTDSEIIDTSRFETIGVIANSLQFDPKILQTFAQGVVDLRAAGSWEKANIVDLFRAVLPEFDHRETGKYLDGRM